MPKIYLNVPQTYLGIALLSQPCGHKGSYSLGVWSPLGDVVVRKLYFPAGKQNKLGSLGSFLWTVSGGSEFPITWAAHTEN